VDVRSAADVSIVIMTWNSRADVLAALRSIDAHAAPITVETIVVDNGSTDGTREAVANDFPHVRVIRRPTNEGFFSRNYGLRAATGRLRMFLDSDAALSAGALGRLVAFLDEHPDVGLVGPKLVYPDGTLQLSTRRFPPLLLPVLRRPPLGRFFEDGAVVRRHLMVDEPHDATREVEYVLGACQLFTAEAQRRAGEIDSWMFYGHDDADWCFRIRTAGLRVVYHPEATVIHDYRRSSAQRPLSRIGLTHLYTFVRFQWKWRRHRRRLIREGAAMDAAALSAP
jgi:N-acetylglucosaminyl-diphospho-decaprenol L-rhamnosyltransferase